MSHIHLIWKIYRDITLAFAVYLRTDGITTLPRGNLASSSEDICSRRCPAWFVRELYEFRWRSEQRARNRRTWPWGRLYLRTTWWVYCGFNFHRQCRNLHQWLRRTQGPETWNVPFMSDSPDTARSSRRRPSLSPNEGQRRTLVTVRSRQRDPQTCRTSLQRSSSISKKKGWYHLHQTVWIFTSAASAFDDLTCDHRLRLIRTITVVFCDLRSFHVARRCLAANVPRRHRLHRTILHVFRNE